MTSNDIMYLRNSSSLVFWLKECYLLDELDDGVDVEVLGESEHALFDFEDVFDLILNALDVVLEFFDLFALLFVGDDVGQDVLDDFSNFVVEVGLLLLLCIYIDRVDLFLEIDNVQFVIDHGLDLIQLMLEVDHVFLEILEIALHFHNRIRVDLLENVLENVRIHLNQILSIPLTRQLWPRLRKTLIALQFRLVPCFQ